MRISLAYITREELADAVRDAQAKGELTEELAELAMRVAWQYLMREKFQGYSQQEKEDMLGDWAWIFVRRWDRIKADGNPFSYITSMVTNSWRTGERGRQRRIRKHEALREDTLKTHQVEGRLLSDPDSTTHTAQAMTWSRHLGRFRYGLN